MMRELPAAGSETTDSARGRFFSRGGRIARRLAEPLVLLIVIVAIALTLEMRSARQHLVHGSDLAATAVGTLKSPAALSQLAARQRARANLVRALREFSSAREQIHRWGPLLSKLTWLPILGSEFSAARPAADAAFYSTRASIRLLDALTPALATISEDAPSAPLLVRIAPMMQSAQGGIALARSDADWAATETDRLPEASGDSHLDRAASLLRRDLPFLRQTLGWLALAPQILGVGRPSQYLFVWENPAELRPTGGFMGAASLMTLNDGQLTSRFTGRLPAQREINSVLLPPPLALYTPEDYWVFSDSNWSPDFTLSARLERWFYGEDTGLWADGVIDFVDTAIPSILHATGAVYVPEYRSNINARNVEQLAQRYVNGQYHGPTGQSGPPDTARKQFFGAVMRALIARLETLPVQRWPALGSAIGNAILRHDLLLYDERPPVQGAIQEAGADNRLFPVPGDYLYVVDDNRSYNKLNPYVHEHIAYSVTIHPDMWLDAVVRINYHVAPSPADLEGSGPMAGLQGSKHDYQDFIRIYAPAGSRLVSMEGVNRWMPAAAYGLTQFAGRLLLRQGQTRVVSVHYRVPPNAFQAIPNAYRLIVRRQPGARVGSVKVSVHGAEGVRVGGGDIRLRSVSVPLDMNRDRTIQMQVFGAAVKRLINIPPQSEPPDPYIPFKYFNDPAHPL